MKRHLALFGALLVAALVGSCTMTLGTTHAKGKVMISAQRAAARSLSIARPTFSGAVRSAAVLPSVRSAALPRQTVVSRTASRARDLYAATDIQSMSYKIVNLDPHSGEADIQDSIAPSWPFLDLYLTPGQKYRITVDVVPTSVAPGTSVGVTRFGDQADFTVSEWDDTWVDLYVKPTRTLVFAPGSVSGTTVNVYDPSKPSLMGVKTFLSSPLTSGPGDKFFYDVTPKLYYFNKAANAVYRWNNTSGTINTVNDLVLDGLTFDNQAGTIYPATIYAVCADPYYPDSLWVVAQDNNPDAVTGKKEWYYYWVDLSTGTPAATWWGPITADLEDGNTGATVVPTGIAVDPTYFDLYISFYNQAGAGGAVHSGVLEYYNGSLWDAIPAAASRVLSGSTSSVITDVAWEQGRLWVMGSPVTTPPWSSAANIVNNTGTAGLWAFDDYLYQYTDLPAGLETVFANTAPTSGARLYLPNRFAGPIQGRSLFVSQQDFASGGTSVLSEVDLDKGTVTDH